jgi:hypothetical protein
MEIPLLKANPVYSAFLAGQAKSFEKIEFSVE